MADAPTSLVDAKGVVTTNDSQEELLHSAYSYVRGVETNKAIAAMTLDHLLQESIDAIKGGESRTLLGADGKPATPSSKRPSRLAVLDSIEKGIDALVKAKTAEANSQGSGK
jgi:hypothetical protein